MKRKGTFMKGHRADTPAPPCAAAAEAPEGRRPPIPYTLTGVRAGPALAHPARGLPPHPPTAWCVRSEALLAFFFFFF